MEAPSKFFGRGLERRRSDSDAVAPSASARAAEALTRRRSAPSATAARSATAPRGALPVAVAVAAPTREAAAAPAPTLREPPPPLAQAFAEFCAAAQELRAHYPQRIHAAQRLLDSVEGDPAPSATGRDALRVLHVEIQRVLKYVAARVAEHKADAAARSDDCQRLVRMRGRVAELARLTYGDIIGGGGRRRMAVDGSMRRAPMKPPAPHTPPEARSQVELTRRGECQEPREQQLGAPKPAPATSSSAQTPPPAPAVETPALVEAAMGTSRWRLVPRPGVVDLDEDDGDPAAGAGDGAADDARGGADDAGVHESAALGALAVVVAYETFGGADVGAADAGSVTAADAAARGAEAGASAEAEVSADVASAIAAGKQTSGDVCFECESLGGAKRADAPGDDVSAASQEARAPEAAPPHTPRRGQPSGLEAWSPTHRDVHLCGGKRPAAAVEGVGGGSSSSGAPTRRKRPKAAVGSRSEWAQLVEEAAAESVHEPLDGCPWCEWRRWEQLSAEGLVAGAKRPRCPRNQDGCGEMCRARPRAQEGALVAASCGPSTARQSPTSVAATPPTPPQVASAQAAALEAALAEFRRAATLGGQYRYRLSTAQGLLDRIEASARAPCVRDHATGEDALRELWAELRRLAWNISCRALYKRDAYERAQLRRRLVALRGRARACARAAYGMRLADRPAKRAVTTDRQGAPPSSLEELRARCPTYRATLGFRHLCEHLCYFREYDPARQLQSLRQRARAHPLRPSLYGWTSRLALKHRAPFWCVIFHDASGAVRGSPAEAWASVVREALESPLDARPKAHEDLPPLVGGEEEAVGGPTSLRSPLGLVEELLAEQDPWRLLVACLLLNRTERTMVDRMLGRFFERWPSAEALANEADDAELLRALQPLGFQRKRRAMLRRFSREYLEALAQAGEPLPMDRLRRLHSVGRYAADAYRIFVRREAEFVQPSDTYLGWFVEHRRSTAGRAPTTPLGDGSSPPDGA